MSGAALGSGIGGALGWLVGSLMAGLTPLVFLACGVYAGALYGGVVGAVRATAPRPSYQFATIRRTQAC